MRFVRYVLLLLLGLTPTILASSTLADGNQVDHSMHAAGSVPQGLVDKVRVATEPFKDINVALNDGHYERFLGCVSGPDAGAMGVHFVNFGLVDGAVQAESPEAL